MIPGLGVSSGGNTAGTTGTKPLGTFVFQGGNNITLSQITGDSGTHTVIFSAGTIPPIGTAVKDVGSAGSTGTITRFAPEDHAHRGLNQFQITGNTSNTSNPVYGSLFLAGGNNITLSQATAAGAATITISAANETQTVPPIATQVTEVMSAGSTGTLTRFAPEDHAHRGVNLFQISGNTSNTSNIVYGSIYLAGGNNITLSQVSAAGKATITISAGGGGAGFSGGMSNFGLGTTGTVSQRLVFIAGGGAALSQSIDGDSATISLFVAAGGVSTMGNTLGDTGLVGVMLLAGGNNITLSASTVATTLGGVGHTRQTVTISGPSAASMSMFEPFYMDEATATGSVSLSELELNYFSLPQNLTFGQVNMIGSASVLNTGAGNTFSFRLTNVQSIHFNAFYTIQNTNFVDLFLFKRGTGGYSTELETIGSTRNSFITNHSLTWRATANHTAGSTGSMTVDQSQSMLISYPMVTSGTLTSVNAVSTFTTWGTGYTTWNSTASTAVTNTYNTTTTASTSIATTHPGTTAWSSWKMIPFNFASSLTPGEYWLGMVRYSSTDSSSASSQTLTAAGTGASYTTTYGASGLTRTGGLTLAGQTMTLASSLGWLGFASSDTMGPLQGHGSFSGTWASSATYLNNGGNPAGAVAFSQIKTEVSFFKSWIQFASKRI